MNYPMNSPASKIISNSALVALNVSAAAPVGDNGSRKPLEEIQRSITIYHTLEIDHIDLLHTA
jgi:hypothetical protein